MNGAYLIRRMIRAWLAAALAGAVTLPAVAQTFRDVTDDSGIDYVQFHRADDTPAAMQSYTTGGVAAGDYDGDGLVDLYVTRLDDRDILYRNRGDGTFADVTGTAFGPAHLAEVQSNGAAWGDIDNDGDLDLYVTSLFSHRFHLFVNDGAGSFSRRRWSAARQPRATTCTSGSAPRSGTTTWTATWTCTPPSGGFCAR